MGLKTKIKLGAIAFCVVVIVAIVFAIYLAMPDTVAVIDDGIKTNNYSREDFYTKYLDLKLEQEEAEKDENAEKLSQSVLNYGQSNNFVPNISVGDITALSQAVVKDFLMYDDGSHGKKYCYTQTSGLQPDITTTINIGGSARSFNTSKRKHSDCSCYVSAMCYVLGFTDSFVHKRSTDFYNDARAYELKTFENSQVGDIIAADGHVAMIVKIENDDVYIGDCGAGYYKYKNGSYVAGHSKGNNPVYKNGGIDLTAMQGWAYKVKKTDSWKSVPSFKSKSDVKLLSYGGISK